MLTAPTTSNRVHFPVRLPIRDKRARYGWYFIAISALFLAVMGYQSFLSYQAASKSAITEAKNLSLVLESKLRGDFAAAERAVSAMVSDLDHNAMRMDNVTRYAPAITRWLRSNVRDISSASALRYFDANGDRLYSSMEGETATNIADRTFFRYLKEHPDNSTFYSEVVLGRYTGRATMYVVKPVRATGGAFLGVALTAMDLGVIRDHFRSIDLGHSGSVALRRLDNGASIVRLPGPLDVDNKPVPDLPTRLAVVRGDPSGYLESTKSPVDQIRRIYGYRQIGEFPFFITLGLSESDYLAGWRNDVALQFVGTFLFLVSLVWIFRQLAVADSRREHTETELRRSTNLIASVIEATSDAVYAKDLDGRYTLFNSAAAGFTGKSAEEAIGRDDKFLFPSEEARTVMTGDRAVMASGANDTYEERVTTASGQLVTFLSTKGPIFDESGKVIGLFGVARDITARKISEDALRQSEARFRAMADTAPVLIWMSGEDKLCSWFNKGWLAFTGRTMEQEMGNGWAEGVHPDDFQRCLDTYVGAFDARKAFEMEYRLRRHDGQYRWIVDSGAPRFDDKEIFLGYIGSCIDVTDRKVSEARLIDERRRLGAILEGTNIGTWEWNVQSGETVFNERWAEIIGYTLGELSPVTIDTWLRFCHPEDVKRSGELLQRHFSGETPYYECEARMLHKAGHWVWVLDRGKVLTWGADGKPVLMYGTHQEISARKEAEAELISAKQAAEAANRAKSEFLASMSHEIRTPLNGVIGNVQLLEMGELDGEMKEYLAAISQSANNLLALINDILDLSKIEAEKVVLEHADFGLRACVNSVVLTQRSRIASKKLALKVTIPPSLPDALIGDELRVKQILLNLLGNAIKFTNAGGITVAVTERERQEGQILLDISVADTGVGMSNSAAEVVFEPFVQADRSIARRYGGTGLGLSICRRLAELMGGSVGVESVEGQGSTFHVLLPFGIASLPVPDSVEKSPDTAPPPAEQGAMILLAEDNEVSQRFSKVLLEKLGHQVVIVENGREALDALATGVFDIVLMDIQMPVMDGTEALAILREREQGTGRHLPVIALTANAVKGDAEKYLADGFDGYVAKPLEIKKLVAEMKRVLQSGRVVVGDSV